MVKNTSSINKEKIKKLNSKKSDTSTIKTMKKIATTKKTAKKNDLTIRNHEKEPQKIVENTHNIRERPRIIEIPEITSSLEPKQITTIVHEEKILIEQPILLEEKPIEIEYHPFVTDKNNNIEEKDNIENRTIKSRKGEKSREANLKEDNTKADTAEEKNHIEAILFSSGKAMSEDIISELCAIDKRKILRLLEELKRDYETRNGALMVIQEGNNWKINVKEKHISAVRKIVSDTELPKSTMETLAVIAWKSPISQSEVVRIRGNKCYDHIAELEDLGFVSKTKKGRSFILKITDKFYEYFDIDHGNLKDILEEIKNPPNQIPEGQTTLGEMEIVDVKNQKNHNDKTNEIFDHRKKLLGDLEVIQIKTKVETEEDRAENRSFLEKIDSKLSEINQMNENYKVRDEQPEEEIREEPTETTENPLIDTEENKNTGQKEENAETLTQSQPTTDQPIEKRPKKLTKKQLEKKFKDDIVKYRDKVKK